VTCSLLLMLDDLGHGRIDQVFEVEG